MTRIERLKHCIATSLVFSLLLGVAAVGGCSGSGSGSGPDGDVNPRKLPPPDFENRPPKVQKKMEKLKITRDS